MNTLSKVLRYASVLLLAAMTTPHPAPAATITPEKPIVVELVTLIPRGTSPHQLLLRMSEQWQQESGGRVKLRVRPDYNQGGEAAMVDKMNVGGIDAALMTVVGLSKIDRGAIALNSIPMAFRSLDEVDLVQERLKPDLEARIARRGFVVLFWTDTGWVRFFSRRPVEHPDDLKKQKLFTWAGDASHFDLMKEAGFKPVSLETANILTSLASGMIDAVPLAPFYANATQVYSEAKHMLELNWAPLVGGAVITKESWERIPPELRASFLKTAAEFGGQIKATVRKESDDAVRAMQHKHGLTVHKVTPEMEAEWRKVAEHAYPQVRGRMVPADMFDKVQQILVEYRSPKTQ